VRTNPTRSSGDILRELQSLFPGRYEVSHLRTLQRGIRKIRTHVLQTHEEVRSPERPDANLPLPAELKPSRLVSESLTSASFPASVDAPPPGDTSVRFSERHQAAEELSSRTGGKTRGFVTAALTSTKRKPCPLARRPPAISSPSAAHPSSPEKSHRLTIAQAVQEYLQAHRTVEHRPKTLECHHMALCHLQQYLLTECHLLLVNQITETTMRDWLASLAQTPTTRGSQRSARAFFSWLVERGVLPCSPLSERAFPRTSAPLPHNVSPASFEQVMRAGFPQKTKALGTKYLATRDQALLWLLFDAGITVSELCALRVRGKGGKERQMPLGLTCFSHLRAYLKQMEPTTKRGLTSRHAGGDPLFGSKGKQPLTRNGVTMLFARFRQRAGISKEALTVKAGANASRMRNGRPEKTNSKEQTSTGRRRPNADRIAPGSPDPNADVGTPITERRWPARQ
jgi:site-specific recombinase XerD